MFTRKKNLHHILIVNDALRIATNEALLWKRKGKEAGGSLVGLQGDNDTSLLLYAIPTGPNADQSGCHVATDAKYQNHCLKFIVGYFRRFINACLKYLADYHSHPMYLARLSSTDKASCREILSDPIHSYLQGMPLILITFKSGEDPIYVPLWITLKADKLVIEDAVMDVVAPDAPQVKEALQGQPYLAFHELMQREEAHITSDGNQGQMPITLQAGDMLTNRLQLEIDEIRQAFGVTPVLKRSHQGHFCLLVETGQRHVMAAIPSEFPLNPPTVFVRQQDGDSFEEFMPRRVWNSLSRIADIIEEIKEKQTPHKAINIQA